MNDEEFMSLMEQLDAYMSTPKLFITDPARMKDITNAINIAKQLFPEANIHLAEDPLGLGALIIRIDDFDLAVRDTEVFYRMTCKADNFEIYSIENEEVRLSVLFNHAFRRVTKP